MTKEKNDNRKLIGAELLPWSGDVQVLRVGIPVSSEFLKVLTELARIRGHDLRRYVEETLHEGVNQDLENPTDIGMDVCKNLKAIIHPGQESG